MTAWHVPALTGVAYLLGLVLHEATHGLGVWATGGKIERLELSLTTATLVYQRSTAHQDNVIRALPVALFVPVVVVAYLLRRPAGWGWLYLAAFALGYLPRSTGDWDGFRQVLAHGSV